MSKFILSILIVLLIFEQKVSSLNDWDSDSPPQLYSTNDTGIIPSNVTNFQDLLFNKNKVTVFQFYNSWCGHCRRYAPIFKEFGKLVTNWHPIVQVAAINCVDESNEEICRNYSIISYPTVRLFWTQVQSQEDTGLHIKDLEFSAEFLRDRVIKFILENLETKTSPINWPNMNKIKVSNQKELRDHQLLFKPPQSDKVVVAIAEKNDSFVGQQLILELSNYKDRVDVLSLEIPTTNELNFTVDTTNKTALLSFETSEKFTVLATLPLTEKNQTAYYVNYIDQNLFDNKLRTAEQRKNDQKLTSEVPKSLSDRPKIEIEPEDSPLQISDLYGSISYTLYHQIPLKKHINGTQLNILKQFFNVVERYFPADDPKFIEFIKNLNQFLKTKEQDLDINDYLNHLKKYDYDFKSKHQGWVTCKGSESKYRGYTCSLWSLFHTLTVNEYLKERDTQKWVNLHEVLYTMRAYIGNFFSCTDCAQHFTGMAQNLENELKYQNSSIVWLWEKHNRVNKRLKGDLTEDPLHPKGVYPYKKNCPSCYLPNGDFNQDEVMKYLIDRYGHVNKRTPKTDSSKLIENSPKTESLMYSFKDSKDQFSFADYSLIVTLYVLITAIVMSVFFYLPMRIRRKAKISNNKASINSSRYLDV